MTGPRVGFQGSTILLHELDPLLDPVILRPCTLNKKLSYVFVLCGFL